MMNPDCRDGKHQACSGLGWDLVKDEPADCTCACHDVKRQADEAIRTGRYVGGPEWWAGREREFFEGILLFFLALLPNGSIMDVWE